MTDPTRFSKDDLVRMRAYQIWIEKGRPEGEAEDHWKKAARLIDLESSAPDRDVDDHKTPAGSPDRRSAK